MSQRGLDVALFSLTLLGLAVLGKGGYDMVMHSSKMTERRKTRGLTEMQRSQMHEEDRIAKELVRMV